jgi:hypothetical protein
MATQLDISDHNKVLIPPWKLNSANSQGAHLLDSVLPPTNTSKTFQLEAKQIGRMMKEMVL